MKIQMTRVEWEKEMIKAAKEVYKDDPVKLVRFMCNRIKVNFKKEVA